MIRRLIRALLRWLGFVERQCGWCKKHLGWKRIPWASKLQNAGTTGICEPCAVKYFSIK